MKAILEFNLPEESEEFDLANRAGEVSGILWDVSQKIRERLKYNDTPLADDVRKFLEELQRDLSDAQDGG